MATKEKLYSIEKECPSYLTQLEQARDILDLKRGDESPSKINSRGRHQWVLRWLLKKLQSVEDVGAISRSSPETWTLIEDLGNVLPASIVTQNFRSFNLLTSVEWALVEAFGQRNSVQGERRISTSSHDTHSEETSSSVTVNGSNLTTSSSRKRKVLEDDHGPSSKRRAVLAEDVPTRSSTRCKASLFLQLSSMLRSVSSQMDDKRQNSPSAPVQTFKTIFQISPSQAAKILAAAIDGLANLHPESSLSVSLEILQQISIHAFEPFLQIWRQRNLASKRGTDFSHDTFTSNCLAPSFKYLHLSREWARKPHLNLAKHYDPSEIIQALENLIARHLLMPCRQAFFMQDSGKDSTGLYDRLKVLKPSNLNSQSSELTEKELNTVQVIPIVFQLGLRCSNLTSPKQRLEETPWMDHMFGATAAFLGFELDQDSSSQPHIPCYEALNKIMSHLVAANVKVKEETLRVLSSRFARSPSLTGDSSFWNCHAEIIALDPTIYLPDREATNDRQMGQPMVNLLTQIRSSAWSVSGLPQGSLAAKRHRTPYNIIKYDILLPIIQAFASTRVLPRLLDLWFNELQHPAIGSIIMRRDHLEQRDKHQSYVWEDFEVSKEIAPSLGASLSPSEFLQLLKDYSTEVTQNIVNAKADSDLRLCAALQVLTTLLLGVRELDSIIMDLPLLEEMITGCMKVLEQFNSKSYNCRWLVWRLLSTATRTWIHFRDGLKATLPDGLAELPIVLHERLYSVSTISMPWSMIQEATEALSCYGTILEEARERHFVIPWSNPPGQLLDMMRNILSSKDADIDDWARYCFVSVIIQRPSLLTPAYSETDEDSQAAAFKLQSDIVRLILNEARNKITSWRKEDQASNIPGARALHDCWQSLFDKILHMEALVPRRDPSVNLGKHSLVVKHLVEMESSAQSAGTQAKDDYLFLRQSYAKIPCVLFKNHDAEPIMKSTMNGLDRLWQNLNKDQVYTAVTSLLHVMSDLEFPGKIDIQEFVSLLSRHLDAQKGLEHFSATQWEQEHALVETLVHVLLKQHVLQGKTIIDPSKWAESATSSKAASLCILNYILHETQRPDTFEERGLYDKFCGRIESESPNEPVSYPIVIECLAGAGKLERDLIMYDRHGKDGTIEKQDRLQRAINPYLQEDEFRTYIEAYMFCKRSKAGINSKEAALQVVHIFSKDTNPVAFRVVDDEIFRVMGGSFPDKMSRNAIEKCCRYPGSRGCWRFFTMLFRHTTKMPSGSVENLYPFEGDWDIFITLCNFLSQTEDVEIFEMISQTLIQIVRHEKFRPTQLAFEALLTALQTLASPSAPSLPTTSARTIFSRICSLTRILLVRAPLRNRLRGRMHLLIPLLQSLLRCFFTQSNRTSSATKDRITLPRWLAAANPSVANADQPPTATISTISKPILKSQTTQNKLLTAKQATHYAQLLTTLVDPSTSSVSTHKYNASAPLTDAVRAARTTTAHHIGPIIAELCACLMKGGTYSAPGVREALMPGIWATLEVMASVNVGGAAGGVVRGRRGDQRGLGMVEVLGASFGDEKGGETEDAEGMRSLLKGLIGEWRRVGGGK